MQCFPKCCMSFFSSMSNIHQTPISTRFEQRLQVPFGPHLLNMLERTNCQIFFPPQRYWWIRIFCSKCFPANQVTQVGEIYFNDFMRMFLNICMQIYIMRYISHSGCLCSLLTDLRAWPQLGWFWCWSLWLLWLWMRLFSSRYFPTIKGQLGVPLTVYPWYLLCSLGPGILGDYNP